MEQVPKVRKAYLCPQPQVNFRTLSDTGGEKELTESLEVGGDVGP